MYYFKDINNGVGTAQTKENVQNVIWITQEEFEELIKEMDDQDTIISEEAN